MRAYGVIQSIVPPVSAPRVADVRVEELEEVVLRDRLRRRVVAVLVLEHRLRREQEAGRRVVLDLHLQLVVDADRQAAREQPARDLEVVRAGGGEGVVEVVVEPGRAARRRPRSAGSRSPGPARAGRRSSCRGGAGSARRSGRRSRSRGRCRTTPCASRRVDRELVPVALAVAGALHGEVRRERGLAGEQARCRCSALVLHLPRSRFIAVQARVVALDLVDDGGAEVAAEVRRVGDGGDEARGRARRTASARSRWSSRRTR